jgi:sugar/nucleoside kinase (ribokinase family)
MTQLTRGDMDVKYGSFYRENLIKNGIDEKLLICDLPSGVASTFISPDGERTFGTYLGAASTLKAETSSPPPSCCSARGQIPPRWKKHCIAT